MQINNNVASLEIQNINNTSKNNIGSQADPPSISNHETSKEDSPVKTTTTTTTTHKMPKSLNFLTRHRSATENEPTEIELVASNNTPKSSCESKRDVESKPNGKKVSKSHSISSTTGGKNFSGGSGGRNRSSSQANHRLSIFGSGGLFSRTNDDSMHRFYVTRLKHSLIVSFLLLLPVQNVFLFFISQFSELVSKTKRISGVGNLLKKNRKTKNSNIVYY